eukprot:CAMPEP_0175155146 /NCGR_PEP_ID=MMETSP0087-20121206/20795_1 /TAXON_ID=136419 /ORGANISM="Unknown Unknown, Strain D1" /LENGTH=454 /DNA_ID=CAMNT_0016442233 /DNA_START=6 /DNA_END=1370 /DNA_ORIENTATION=-
MPSLGENPAWRKLQDSGNDAAARGSYLEAVALFSQSLELAATHLQRSRLYESIAQCYLALGEEYEGKAVEAASEAVQIDDRWSDGYVTLGRCFFNQGSFAQAESAFSLAINFVDPAETEEIEQLRLELVEASELAHKTQEAKDTKTITILDKQLTIKQWRAISPEAKVVSCAVHSQHHSNIQETSGSGTGAMIWECGIVLAKYVENNLAEQLEGKNVLELGCGTGIVGLCLAALGANVWLTDEAPVLSFALNNTRANSEFFSSVVCHSSLLTGAGQEQQHKKQSSDYTVVFEGGKHGGKGNVFVTELDWTAPPWYLPSQTNNALSNSDGSSDENEKSENKVECDPSCISCEPLSSGDHCFDFIVASDCIFASHAIGPFISVLRSVLNLDQDRNSQTKVLFAHKSRHSGVDEELLSNFSAAGLQTTLVPQHHHHPDFTSPSIHIYVLSVISEDAN